MKMCSASLAAGTLRPTACELVLVNLLNEELLAVRALVVSVAERLHANEGVYHQNTSAASRNRPSSTSCRNSEICTPTGHPSTYEPGTWPS